MHYRPREAFFTYGDRRRLLNSEELATITVGKKGTVWEDAEGMPMA